MGDTEILKMDSTMNENLIDMIRKTPLRPLLRWPYRKYMDLRRSLRRGFFRKTLKTVVNNPDLIFEDSKILADLSFGWANEEYSANLEYLQLCLEYAAREKLPILECGSGLSTILLGLIARDNGTTIWTLEHVSSWYKLVQQYLHEFQIDNVKLLLSPPKKYGELTWYDVPMNLPPDQFSLVICDGHPSNKWEEQYNLFPVMKHKFMSGCTVLLDTGNQDPGQAFMSYWATELDLKYEVYGNSTPYYIVHI